jgi:GST-like protein
VRLPQDTDLINIGKDDHFAPEFLKVSPNNRMHAIIDPD